MATKRIVLSLLAGLGMMAAIATPTLAQTRAQPNSADLLRDPQGGDSLTNLFNNRPDASPGGLMNLIQQLGQPGLDPAAFQAQQRANLDAATEAFRAQQRQRLQNSAQPRSPQPAVAPTITLPVQK